MATPTLSFRTHSRGVPAGNHPSGVPEDSGRVWVNYAFCTAALRGWSVGAGVYAASSQYVDNLNLYQTPGYFTVDAKIGYENEHFRASLNVKNLTGEKYFVRSLGSAARWRPAMAAVSTARWRTNTDHSIQSRSSLPAGSPVAN